MNDRAKDYLNRFAALPVETQLRALAKEMVAFQAHLAALSLGNLPDGASFENQRAIVASILLTRAEILAQTKQ
jgi:hypothetical protein